MAKSLDEKNDLENIRMQAESYLNLKKAPFQYITLLANTLVRINCISALEAFNKLIQITLLDLQSVDYLLLEEKVNEILIAYAI